VIKLTIKELSYEQPNELRNIAKKKTL